MAEHLTLLVTTKFFVPTVVFSVGFFSGWGVWQSAKDFALVFASSLAAVGVVKGLHMIFTKFFN